MTTLGAHSIARTPAVVSAPGWSSFAQALHVAGTRPSDASIGTFGVCHRRSRARVAPDLGVDSPRGRHPLAPIGALLSLATERPARTPVLACGQGVATTVLGRDQTSPAECARREQSTRSFSASVAAPESMD